MLIVCQRFFSNGLLKLVVLAWCSLDVNRFQFSIVAVSYHVPTVFFVLIIGSATLLLFIFIWWNRS